MRAGSIAYVSPVGLLIFPGFRPTDCSRASDMQYRPYGSLHELIHIYHHRKWTVPEPAIWSIFTDLVDACLVLQYGSVEAQDADDDWRPIVHREIKFGNVLLDLESPNKEFPSYPQIKLANFGAAVMTDDNDAMNPNGYNDGTGTPYWRPPEHISFLRRKTLAPDPGKAFKLGEKTNVSTQSIFLLAIWHLLDRIPCISLVLTISQVWGVGAIILRLMNSDPTPYGPDYKFYRAESPRLNDAGRQFSKELQELVQLCVKFIPADRPALRDIRAQIIELTNPDVVPDLAEGMRTEEKAMDRTGLRLRHKADDDRYKLAAAGIQF